MNEVIHTTSPNAKVRSRYRSIAGGLAAFVTSALLLTACASTGNDSSQGQGDGGTPVQGGVLTVGLVGGSNSDSLDPMIASASHPDSARTIALYDTLTTIDEDGLIEMSLAESLESDEEGTVWTLKLRDDIKFSDGSPIEAEDVAYSISRIFTDENPTGIIPPSLQNIDLEGLDASSPDTLVVPFTEANVIFPEVMAHYSRGIVPVGFSSEDPVSSGPFMVESFTPGEQSTFVPNPHYRVADQPYLDQLVIINFADDASRVNALLAGQVDVIEQVPQSYLASIEKTGKLTVMEAETGGWVPITMRADVAPFDDVRVRQAMRLIVDREQMVTQVLGGHGQVGNDVFGPLDGCDVTDGLPQREQDIEEAKKLLAEAGQSDLEVELVTTPAVAGMVESAQVFAEQAKAAGVTVTLKQVDPGTFYGEQYMQWPFAQNFYYTRGFLSQATTLNLKDSMLSETHWNNDELDALIRQAGATVDETERCGLLQEAAKIQWEEGAYIIWGFPNNIDAFANNVHGLRAKDGTGIPLGGYRFDAAWLSQ